MPTLAIIPARGGSTELRRKNLLPVDGQPMFLRSAQAAKDAGCEVIVSTDDAEIESTARVAGFTIHQRGPELADTGVDLVVSAASVGWDGPIMLVQPTVQPITAAVLVRFMGHKDNRTRSLGIPAQHQIWIDGWQTERVNRQDQVEPAVAEVGVRWWPDWEHVGELPEAMFYTDRPLVDIDTAADYRSVTIPKSIALWPIADKTHGMGHLRRCLAIAERLQHHEVTFVTNSLSRDALDLVISRGWNRSSVEALSTEPRLWILDRLSNENLSHLPGNVITFEDTSQYQADVKIDALYADGSDWCVLRPEFTAGDYQVRDTVENVLLLFGGTDPAGLGDRLFPIVADMVPAATQIKPGDNVSVAAAMHEADLLITSAGRTVYEAAAVGVPTIVLAQNLRETTHQHLGMEHGNIYLGLGDLVSDQAIIDTIRTVSDNKGLRSDLSERGRPDGKGLDRIIHRIEGLLGGF